MSQAPAEVCKARAKAVLGASIGFRVQGFRALLLIKVVPEIFV